LQEQVALRQLIKSPADMPNPDTTLVCSDSKHMCLYSVTVAEC
jgi:hypothetical protein